MPLMKLLNGFLHLNPCHSKSKLTMANVLTHILVFL